jgi:acyl carrier protein
MTPEEPLPVTELDLPALAMTAWVEVLGGPMVPDSNFFEAGGDSLRAMRITAKLSSACGVKVPLSLVFDNPRLVDFADSLASFLSTS